MPPGSRVGLAQLERMQGFKWGDGARNDQGLWIDGDTLYFDGYIASRNGPRIDPRAFGACGPGVSDCTTAIQAALDYAATNQGTVILGAGTFNYTQLQLSVGTSLIGAGPTATFLKRIAGSTGSGIVMRAGQSATKLKIADLRVDGNGVGSLLNGIELGTESDAMAFAVGSSIQNVIVSACTGYGLKLNCNVGYLVNVWAINNAGGCYIYGSNLYSGFLNCESSTSLPDLLIDGTDHEFHSLQLEGGSDIATDVIQINGTAYNVQFFGIYANYQNGTRDNFINIKPPPADGSIAIRGKHVFRGIHESRADTALAFHASGYWLNDQYNGITVNRPNTRCLSIYDMTESFGNPRTFTATLTGLTAVVTGTVTVCRVGKLVTIFLPSGLSGTSNTTAATLTIADNARSDFANWFAPANAHTWPALIRDNSTWAWGLATLGAASTTITLYATLPGGAFTNSGVKAVGEQTFTFVVDG